MMTGELDNHLLAICSCPNGHRYLVHQAHSAPEIIFSAGARAFLAGFYSESVVTLTAALERGHELFVKVFLLTRGSACPDIDEFWKELRNSSERQLGAFCVTYFLASGSPWKPDPKQAEFRNKVAHKGYIATREEALRYAEYVTSKLNTIMSHIKAHHSDEFHQHLKSGRAKIYRKAEEVRSRDTGLEMCFAGSSALEWNNFGRSQPTFEDVLEATSSYLAQFSDGV